MKKLLFILLAMITLTSTTCSSGSETEPTPEQPETPGGNENDMDKNTIKLTAGSKVFTATLVDNSSTRALKELLAQGDISINMRDYGNMEKVGSLGTTLPRNDEYFTTAPGDLILYQGNSFVIYYAPNTYSLTRLGKIDNVTQAELIDALGRGEVTITLSLDK